MDSSSGDLETKYHKIAAEYSKLRAQASVLKKAVVEEQSRNIALHDVLREREQNVRKSSQEIDSLTFRNQQLTKRVTVLQNELDATENRSKRGKSKVPDGHSCVDCTLTMNILDEELQKKILENAELLSKINDEDAVHKQELAALHTHADRLKHELEKYSEAKSASEKKLKEIIDKLEIEKATTSGKNSTLFSDGQFNLQRDVESHLRQGLEIILNPLSFVGRSTNKDITEVESNWGKLKLADVISKTGDFVLKFIAAITDYHTFTEERLGYLQSTLSPVNHTFSSHLKECSSYLRRIQLGFSELQRAASESRDDSFRSGLPVLSEQLTAYTRCLLKLLPYQLLSLEEENAASSSKEHLVSSNMEVALQLNYVISCFVKLGSYIKLLSSQSEQLLSPHSTSSQCSSHQVLFALADSIKSLSLAFADKRCQEQEMSTISEKVKASNDSIVRSLSSMAVASEKVCNVLSDNHLKPSKSTRAMEPTNRMANGRGSENSTRDILLDDDDEEEQGTFDADTLSDQLARSRKTAVLLEQEKEHWHLEYKLLQLKHSKRIEELEQKLMLSQTSGATENRDDNQLLTKEQLLGTSTITNLLGRLDAPVVLSTEMEAREQEVKNYLTSRIDHLVATCQGAETKAVALRAECAVLRKRLDLCMSNKMQCECRLGECLKQVVKLQEELHTTTHNYETQLSIMSEHLANMNDKLAVQRDEIDQLKYQLTNKPSQKRKQK